MSGDNEELVHRERLRWIEFVNWRINNYTRNDLSISGCLPQFLLSEMLMGALPCLCTFVYNCFNTATVIIIVLIPTVLSIDILYHVGYFYRFMKRQESDEILLRSFHVEIISFLIELKVQIVAPVLVLYC